MAANEVFKVGGYIGLPVPADTPAGAPVRVGGINAVTTVTEGTGGNKDGYASCKLDGAHQFDVTGSVPAYGTPIYITSGGALNVTAAGNSLYGHALSIKTGATIGPVTVRIDATGPTTAA